MVKKLSLYVVSLTAFFLSFVSPVLANSADDPAKLDGVFIGNIVTKVSNLLFPVAVIIGVAMLIYGGYMWISSTGEPDKIKQASGTITWAILGLIFVVVVKYVLELVLNFILK